MYGTASVFVRRCLAAFALVCLHGLASATIINGLGGASIEYVTGGANIMDGSGMTFQGSTWTSASNGARAASVAENYSVRVAGNDLAITVGRTVAAGDIAIAAVAVGAAAVAGAQVGAAISHAIGNDTVTIGNTRCTASYTGWHCDEGEEATTYAGYCTALHPVESTVTGGPWCGNTAAQAVTAYAAALTAWPPGGFGSSNQSLCGSVACKREYRLYSGTDSNCSSNASCLLEMRFQSGGSSPTWSNWSLYDRAGVTAQTVVNPCGASIDALNPAWSVAAGSAPGPDGKCPTGRYNASPTSDYVANRIAQYAPQDKLGELGKAVQDANQPIQNASTRAVSGPASKAGQQSTSTTTNPDGTTTTTTSTPTTNYTYNDNHITYNTTNVTNVVNNTTGATTTTTTTNAADQQTECAKHPDSAGCAALGTPPADGSLPKSNTPVTYSPVQFDVATCPTAVSFTAFGVARTLEFSPMCDAATTWVKPVILVIAAAIGAFIFVGGLKS